MITALERREKGQINFIGLTELRYG